MATKNWKKTMDNPSLIEWQNTKGDILRIGENYDGSWDIKIGLYHGYMIRMQDEGIVGSKAEAIKFANQYMRTH